MNRYLIVPDTHGVEFYNRNKIIDFLEASPNNTVVNLGDFFDGWNNNPLEQLAIFEWWCDLKRKFSKQVIILEGNHECQYDTRFNPYLKELMKGYQEKYRFIFSDAIRIAVEEKLIDFVVVRDKYVFSHAGITKTFLRAIGVDNFLKDLEYINQPHKEYMYCSSASSGFDEFSGPFWARPNELINDNPFTDLIQVVGHTATDCFGYYCPVFSNNIFFCDCKQLILI